MTEVLQVNRRNRPCVYFQQGKCNRPQCNFTHGLVPPTMIFSKPPSDSSSSQNTSLNTPVTHSHVASDDAPPPPHRPSAYKTRPCRFYAKGRCNAGDGCRWSHDETLMGREELPTELPGDDYLSTGYKLVPKSYRTQPCARFLAGHCYYGDQCNFIHSTTPQTSCASTPSALAQQTMENGPSPPLPIIKSHSTQHSPVISSLHAPGIRSSMSAATPSASGAALSAPTRPRELPPPPSQSHLSGIDWSVPTPGTPGRGGTNTPPVFASSPLITAGQPVLSRSNSVVLQGQDSRPTSTVPHGLNGSVQTNLPPSQMRSPFLFTFGEIGPGSAMNSPRGLGLNGANLAPVGTTTTSNSASPSLVSGRLAASPAVTRLASPGLSGSALGTTGITGIRQKSRLSTSTDIYPEADDHDNADADTEADFPSITYSTLGDLVTEPDEELDGRLHPHMDYGGLGMENGTTRSGYITPNGAGYGEGPPALGGGYANGMGMAGYGERDWGIALNALNEHAAAPPYGGPSSNVAYQDTGYGYKMRPCKFYVVGSRCPSGQNCTFIHDPEALRRPSINSYPAAPIPPEMHPLYRTRECKYHLAGQCHQAEGCAFKHTGPPGQGREYENWEGFSIQVNDHDIAAEDRTGYRSRPCKWFLKGNCFHGENCTYSHANHYSRPACIFFRNGAGHCINGEDCRFAHDVYTDDDASYAADQGTDASFGDDSRYDASGPSEHHTSAHAPPVFSTTIAEDVDALGENRYNEPYFGGGGLNGLVNGMDSLTVQGPRMELVVSEGEEDEEDEDIVVLRPNGPKAGDPTSQDVERLFASSSL